MKKLKKPALLILLFLILIPAVLIFINVQKSKRLDTIYKDPSKGVASAHYAMHELKFVGKNLVSQTADYSRDHNVEIVTNSYLRYDTLKKQIVITTEEPVERKDDVPTSDKITHISYFSLDGKLIDHKSGLYRVADAGLENTMLLKDVILPFQKWKDETEEIYLKHFGIETFDFSVLNPFSLGSINGGTPLHAWSGTGYYDLKIGNEVIKFKLPAKKEQVFFTEKNSYTTNLRYYKLPSAGNLTSAALLLYFKDNGKPMLFLIKAK